MTRNGYRPRLTRFFLPSESGQQPPFATVRTEASNLLFWGIDLDNIVVLRISDNDGVNLNGVKLNSTTEVADALEKIRAENPDITVSVEATDSEWYESIGKAIYGSHRAGFSGERFRVLIDGKPMSH